MQPQQPVQQPASGQPTQQPVASNPQQTQGSGVQPQGSSQPQPAPAAQQARLDDAFLQSIGLGVLPPEERQGMLEQMVKTLQLNVGMEIYKRLQENQIREFEGLMPFNDENGNVVISQDQAYQNALQWLDLNVPGYRQDPNMGPRINDINYVLQTTAQYWLQRNFPQYRDVVFAEQDKIMGEVRSNVPQIVAAVNGAQAAAPQIPQ